jgi:DNA invertase Pin-like site-specific DNA recombinase
LVEPVTRAQCGSPPQARRCFRSCLDALQTIQELKKRGVSLWLPDLGGCLGNGISEMMLTILAAGAEFERVRIGERSPRPQQAKTQAATADR